MVSNAVHTLRFRHLGGASPRGHFEVQSRQEEVTHIASGPVGALYILNASGLIFPQDRHSQDAIRSFRILKFASRSGGRLVFLPPVNRSTPQCTQRDFGSSMATTLRKLAGTVSIFASKVSRSVGVERHGPQLTSDDLPGGLDNDVSIC